MAETERTLIGIVEDFRVGKPRAERVSYEESEEKTRILRNQLQNLIRAHVAPPHIIETESFGGRDDETPDVRLDATVPSVKVAIGIIITANMYPLRLTEEEFKIPDEEHRQKLAYSRLNGITYSIQVDYMDHMVVISDQTRMLSVVPDHEGWGALASVDSGSTVLKREFNREDFRLYEGLLERLSSDPSVSFKGHARDIQKYVPRQSERHYVRRPAEMGQPQASA